ncbi:hypothetical protein [Actinoplanes xinjiangensis]|nr:hypothetical protein [Actinoplanes xinjiangensis]
MRIRRRTAVVMVLLLVAGIGVSVVAYRQWFGSSAVSVGSSGGRIGPADGPAQLEVPVGAVEESTEVTIAADTPDPAWTRDATAIPLGTGADITPAAPLPGASVRIPLTEDDLATITAHGSTANDVLIFVYEPGIDAWVPLPTTFDTAAGQVVAPAPHFSRFRPGLPNIKLPTELLDKVSNAAKKGLSSLQKFATGLFSEVAKNLRERLTGEQQDIACPNSRLSWTVTATVDENTGCVELPDDGREAVQLRSTLNFPQVVTVPAGASVAENPYWDDLDPVGRLVSFLDRSTGHGYVDALGRGQVMLPKGTTPLDDTTALRMEPDKLGLALTTVLSLLELLPGAKSWLVVLEDTTVLEQLRVVKDSAGSLSVAYDRIETVVRESSVETVDKPSAVKQAESFLALAECVTTAVTEVTSSEERSLPAFMVTVFDFLRDCTSTLQNTAVSGYLDVLDTVGSVVGVLRTVFDAGLAGLRSWGGRVDVTVRHRIADPLKDTNWKKAYPQACPFEDQGFGRSIDDVVRADFTGDEVADAVVVASCEQDAGRTSQETQAFDGAGDPKKPTSLRKLLGTTADTEMGPPVTVTVTDSTITVQGWTFAFNVDGDLTRISQTYTWNGKSLDAEPIIRTDVPIPACLPSGAVPDGVPICS